MTMRVVILIVCISTMTAVFAQTTEPTSSVNVTSSGPGEKSTLKETSPTSDTKPTVNASPSTHTTPAASVTTHPPTSPSANTTKKNGIEITLENGVCGGIVFIVDASESMDADEFEMEKTFVSDVVNNLKSSRFGAIVFSETVETVPFKKYNDKTKFITEVMAKDHLRSGTNTHLALATFLGMINNDTDHKHVGIVITDGASRDKNKTIQAAEDIRTSGNELLAVGIGNDIDKDELEAIAGNRDNVVYVSNFEALNTFVKVVAKAVCPRPTRPPPFNGTSPCDDCHFENGVGYVAHPYRCDVFYQCEEGRREAHLRACAPGTLWSQRDLVCSWPSDANCSSDPCHFEGVEHYAHPGSCRRYWICRGNRTYEADCCRKGYAYSPNGGCMPSETCEDHCGTETEVPCNLVAVAEDHEKFLVIGTTWEMPCAPGTAFVQDDCKCTKFVPVVPIEQACVPELYLPFDNDTRDHSGNELPFGLNGKVTIEQQIDETIGGGAAWFNGFTRMIFWRFANDDFRQSLVIRFRYLELEGSETRNKTVVANNKCKGNGYAFTINYDPTTGQTHGHLKNESGYEKILTNDNAGFWKDVEFKYHDGEFTLTVNGDVQSNYLGGNIDKSLAALQIGGSCDDTDYFRGWIDEFYLYKCIPESEITTTTTTTAQTSATTPTIPPP